MKIAIEKSDAGFVSRWVEFCKKEAIPHKIVDPCSNTIISELSDCDAFMWHWSHVDFAKLQFARQLTMSLEQAGKKVFPDSRTSWHFDDKVGQKYLLEALGAPLVDSYVFYTRDAALDWCGKTTFPKVFKLRGGAGASNVRLVRTRAQAQKLIRQAFARGIPVFDRLGHLRDAIWKFKSHQIGIVGVAKALARSIIGTRFSTLHGRERGYVYFQDFIPDNNSDIRVVAIGKRAFAIRRMCRKGDFRASGSGLIEYPVNDDAIKKCVEICFAVNRKLQMQSCAMDFVYSGTNPYIVEISYGFTQQGYEKCPGYWDDELRFHEGKFNPQYWMVEDLIASVNGGKNGPER